MIKEISPDVYFVAGAQNSAIYNFQTQNVYSINSDGSQILKKAIENGILSQDEHVFLSQVKTAVGISEIIPTDIHLPEFYRQMHLQFVWLELTQKCNNRCLHCYEGQSHSEADTPLALSQWIHIIDQLATLKCSGIQFIGGEPTMFDGLEDLIYYAADRIKTITIFSNLRLLDEKILRAISTCKVHVSFSIYGSTPAAHDGITQIPGSFSALTDNLKLLIKNNVQLQACVVIMKENEAERTKIVNFLHLLGIKNIKYDEIRKVSGGCQSSHLVKESWAVRTKPNFVANKDKFFRAMAYNTCWYGKMAISTNGDVFPCEFERNIIYGNIKKQNIAEILQNQTLKESWTIDFSKISECKECEYRFSCRDCRPNAFAETANLYCKNPRCRYQPNKGTWNL